MGWSETIVPKGQPSGGIERMSDEEMIKAIEERAKQTRDQFEL